MKTPSLEVVVLVLTGLSAIMALWEKLRADVVLDFVTKRGALLLALVAEVVVFVVFGAIIATLNGVISRYAGSLGLGDASLQTLGYAKWITNGLLAIVAFTVILAQVLRVKRSGLP